MESVRVDDTTGPPDQAIGSRLREERERQGLSLRKLAGRLDISPSALSQIETGRSRPSVSTLYAIVSELGISFDELFAPPERRAELLSAYLLCCYSGNSLPAVGVAVLARFVGRLWADVVFAAILVVLAFVALAIGLRHERRSDRAR